MLNMKPVIVGRQEKKKENFTYENIILIVERIFLNQEKVEDNKRM